LVKNKATAFVTICAAVSVLAAQGEHQIFFNRYQAPVRVGLFIADVDGRNERPLLPADGLDYSPSFSADGNWIAFTSERSGSADIYRARVDGSSLERLTDDPAYDDQAAFSPDGTSLVFVSSRAGGQADIWILDLESRSAQNITNYPGGDFRPSWSPDGDWIAFTSDRDSKPGFVPRRWEPLQSTGLYVIRKDGTGLRRLTPEGGFAGTPRWSGDGLSIIYYETSEEEAWYARAGASDAVTQIASIHLATGKRSVLTSGPGVKLWPHWLPDGQVGYVRKNSDVMRSPSWPADGSKVVYQKTIQVETAGHTATVYSRNPEFELVWTPPFPAFAPSGAQWASSVAPDGDITEAAIEIRNADGSQRRTIFHRRGFSAFAPSWSPDGTRIAFGVGRYFRPPGNPAAQIVVTNADGSDYRAVVDEDANNGFPSWSPDGNFIVYKRNRNLAVISLDAGQIQALTNGRQYDNFPQWSPAGDAIAFTSDRTGDFEIYSIKPDGTGIRQLTNSPGNDSHPAWSPDGQWIIFTSARMGFKDEGPLYDGIPQPDGELFIMRPDGSAVRQLTDNQWEDATAAWFQRVRPK
jgi:Tol biopolymer transport system component